MGMREIRVYDGDFPTMEQMLAGGPAAAFPKEIWLPQVQPGEFAVRYKDFKSGLARTPAGKPVQSSEICRIFDSLEEARTNSREVANGHWTVGCIIYDHTGAQVDTISNNKEVGKFAVVAYVGILLWVGIFAAMGMSFIFLSKLTLVILKPFPSVHKLLTDLGWFGWTVYAFAGLLVGILAWYLRIRFIAKKRADRLQAKLKSAISPEEKKRFEELNTLHGSKDPAERERFLRLLTEYQNKVGEAMKK
jgi:hypothetical protein